MMEPPANLSDEELAAKTETYHRMVEVRDCFGLSDLRYYHALLREVDRRGLTVQESIEVVNR